MSDDPEPSDRRALLRNAPVDTERQIKVFCGNQSGSTDVIVDVFGYYL